MSPRSNPLFWSFSLGTWFQTRVRVSWLLLAIEAWLVYEFGWSMGLAVGAILFVSILLHEFSHVAMSRAVGVGGDEILMWPLGGLAYIGGHAAPRQQLLISAAGPLCNLLLCLAVLYPVLVSGSALDAFNPLYLPVSKEQFAGSVPLGLSLLTFSLNWMLLLLNLIPAMPLDGGQMTRSALALRLGGPVAFEASIKVASFVALAFGLVAMLILKSAPLLGLAAFLFIFALLETQQAHSPEAADDSFMGYDFSQGYTSLERAEAPAEAPQPQPGFFERWKKRREEARLRREAERTERATAQLDALLAKVHDQGLQSLSDAERRMLKQASDRLRSHRDKGE